MITVSDSFKAPVNFDYVYDKTVRFSAFIWTSSVQHNELTRSSA